MLIKKGSFKPQYYKGILEKAFHNLHQDIFEIAKPFLKKDALILDFGCGEGAFTQRLKDNGYTVYACDVDASQFKAVPDRFIHLDLNKDNIKDNFDCQYDVIVAMEIIEHLENSWKFIRDIKSLLKPGGILILSTPNTSNFASRIRFLQKGNALGFEENDLSYGHINPITSFHLENIFSKIGFEILVKKDIGDIPLFHFENLSRYTLLRNMLLPFLYPFMGGDKKGWCLGYVLQLKVH